MGGAGAGQFGLVLGSAGQGAGVGRLLDRTAGGFDQSHEFIGDDPGIHLDGRAALAELGKGFGKFCRLADFADLGEVGFLFDAGLAGVEEEFGQSVGMDDGAGQWMWCVRHICAADVERPGDGGGVGNQSGIGAARFDALGNRCDLIARQRAGMLVLLDGDAAKRFSWTVGP